MRFREVGVQGPVGGSSREVSTLQGRSLLTPDSWRAVGEQLARARGSLSHAGSQQMWDVGDWLRDGEDEVFKRLNRSRVRTMAAAITGYSRHTLSMAVSLARKMGPSMRIEGLTWWHHLAVAGLDAEMQSHWLTRAAEEGWSIRELRARLSSEARAGGRRPGRPVQSVVTELIRLNRDDIPDSLLVQLRQWWEDLDQAG
jgi:hypothetical protein